MLYGIFQGIRRPGEIYELAHYLGEDEVRIGDFGKYMEASVWLKCRGTFRCSCFL